MAADLADLWPIILQTAIIVVAIAASYGRIKERIAVLETEYKHHQSTIDGLATKVDGMSRSLAKVEK